MTGSDWLKANWRRLTQRPQWQTLIWMPLIIIALPAILFVKLILLPFERPLERTAEEVAEYLRDRLDDNVGEWMWKDFVSIPIADRRLEGLRKRALALSDPLTDEDKANLRLMLVEAEWMARSGRYH